MFSTFVYLDLFVIYKLANIINVFVLHTFLYDDLFHYRHIHQSDLEEHADIGGDTCYTVDDRGTRKFLFKKRSTSSTCAVNMTTMILAITQSLFYMIPCQH